MFSLTKHISLAVYLYLIPAKRQGNLAKFWEARRGDVFWPSKRGGMVDFIAPLFQLKNDRLLDACQ